MTSTINSYFSNTFGSRLSYNAHDQLNRSTKLINTAARLVSDLEALDSAQKSIASFTAKTTSEEAQNALSGINTNTNFEELIKNISKQLQSSDKSYTLLNVMTAQKQIAALSSYTTKA